MSGDTGERGLHVFMGWVESGQDWDSEGGTHGVAEGAHAAGQTKKENVKWNIGRRFTEFTKKRALRVLGSIYRVVAQAVCLTGIAVLLMMIPHLPVLGSADNPANNEAVRRYLGDGLSETEAVNTVAGIVLDYRALDTFGESVVLFLSAVSAIALMRRKSGSGSGGGADQGGRRECKRGEERDTILGQAARLLVPFIPIFDLYVVLNDHLFPGGGSSRGMVMGVGLVLCTNALEYRRIHRFFSFKTFIVVSSGALMAYTLSKGYSFFVETNRLESDISLGKPGNILSAGLILPLDIYVGLVVAGAMYCFYSLFREGEV